MWCWRSEALCWSCQRWTGSRGFSPQRQRPPHLIALLIAFTFNLDQPQWTLLTVFIVSQPRADGAVLGKSFYRIIGTFIGAAVALVLVALVAQERVLFLGGIALWVGICTLGSQYARSWSCI